MIAFDHDRATILHGDCVEALAQVPDNSIAAVVTDPPYELGFMGKAWDAAGVAFDPKTWGAILRVLKPGGHVLAFGGTRTYHRMTCAIEDAGFEVRDSLHWFYGTGFPKSLNVSKAIDTSFGETQPIVAEGASGKGAASVNAFGNGLNVNFAARPKTAPVTAAAAAWHGWGTALKPGHEPIAMARKPLEGTVAANVQTFGTGALNIDACRLQGEDVPEGRVRHGGGARSAHLEQIDPAWRNQQPAGRWPANVLLDEAAAGELDAQSGGASRFFYVAKPGRRERDFGCEALFPRSAGEATDREDGTDGLNSPRAGAGRTGGARNFHPTVKPIDLMRYLVRLITPLGGVVLDPFLGSGTTGIAALREGFDFIGIEKSDEYLPIAIARVRHALEAA